MANTKNSDAVNIFAIFPQNPLFGVFRIVRIIFAPKQTFLIVVLKICRRQIKIATLACAQFLTQKISLPPNHFYRVFPR